MKKTENPLHREPRFERPAADLKQILSRNNGR